MSQLTLRISEDLAADLKAAAAGRGMSVNGFASAVLAASVNPDLGESEMERLRGRLDRAGLLESGAAVRARPSRDRIEAARAKAGKGSALSDLVAEGRR